ncbi:MAG: hypothetical protein OEY30_01890 [Candidatus Bathyarchaeota archaeon]|nr:hypothetical protein [Candidatus Bathyarchaeota archaeon]
MMKKAAVELVFTAEEFDLSVITEDYIRHMLRKKKLTVQGEGPSVDITICKINEEALKVTICFTFDEKEFDLNTITQPYIEKILKEKKLILGGKWPSAEVQSIETLEE